MRVVFAAMKQDRDKTNTPHKLEACNGTCFCPGVKLSYKEIKTPMLPGRAIAFFGPVLP